MWEQAVCSTWTERDETAGTKRSSGTHWSVTTEDRRLARAGANGRTAWGRPSSSEGQPDGGSGGADRRNLPTMTVHYVPNWVPRATFESDLRERPQEKRTKLQGRYLQCSLRPESGKVLRAFKPSRRRSRHRPRKAPHGPCPRRLPHLPFPRRPHLPPSPQRPRQLNQPNRKELGRPLGLPLGLPQEGGWGMARVR